MNNYFYDEEKNKKGKSIISVISVFVLLTICIITSYIITNRLTNQKYHDDNLQKVNDKMVYNSNSILDDEMSIVIIKDGEAIKKQTIKEFKEENDISIDINEYFLVDYFNIDGYELSELTNGKIVFSKETQKIVLDPNKYYLGEKDGYFAIYKTDKQGKPFIEDSKDVYKNNKMVNTIPMADQEEIKSFKHSYDTKEEAKEIISAYIS